MTSYRDERRQAETAQQALGEARQPGPEASPAHGSAPAGNAPELREARTIVAKIAENARGLVADPYTSNRGFWTACAEDAEAALAALARLPANPPTGAAIKHAFDAGFSAGSERDEAFMPPPPTRADSWELYACTLTDRNLIAPTGVDAPSFAKARASFDEFSRGIAEERRAKLATGAGDAVGVIELCAKVAEEVAGFWGDAGSAAREVAQRIRALAPADTGAANV